MDYNQLKTFTEVAHIGNLTQAAERLHLSQPAVSAQIKSLEKRLDVTLFKRTTNGMELTPAGEVFLPEAETLLQHHHKLDCFAKTLAEHYVAHADIGLIHPVPSDKITRLTEKVLGHDPDILFHIQYGMSGEIEQRVLDKQLHGGFFLGPVNHRSLRSIFLQDIHYSLICPLEAEETVREDLPASLGQYAWIEMSGVSGSRKHMQQFWRKHKISPKRQIICDYSQTIIDLVCQGTGVAVVPEHRARFAKESGRPIAVIEEYRQTMPLHFIYLNEFEEDPILNLLKNCVEEVWGI
ncbi:LysR family transcriptional regulator [Neisseria sp. Dent CA1/247]|uniref:LysR family transcriptional regulator n=1 Tax=Neisseria zoodegmatis TaxID=326523 RepID=A0A1X3CTD6_9NEIS|nr:MULTISPECIES: LysR family transcriptional regulator [Neisseria]OSI10878.1 LysR family transcriptional regulator [Neisseria zoodegmatis]UOO75973.1 LysR family transcriptional regulator [Neisseria sp. Dent CA1/247]SNU80112.1 LysR family transcriptional regulator [Neisseria zoodegmatis]SUA35844.1 LysR family transcriptional regulator [Neisseria zoodegmatis]